MMARNEDLIHSILTEPHRPYAQSVGKVLAEGIIVCRQLRSLSEDGGMEEEGVVIIHGLTP